MNYPKVFDLEGNERDWEYVVEKYGVELRRGTANEDGEIHRLIELREKTGHSSLITQVLDENGQPIDQMDVAFYWPDAPDPPDPPTTLLPHDWYPNFTHGLTNLNGDVGPGMGPGAYHGEGEGGPHAVWVRDPDVPSDICEKLGMLAGTFHNHFDQKFQLVSGGEPDLPNPDEFEVVDTIVTENTESNMLYLAYPIEISYDTDVHAASSAEKDLDTTPLESLTYEERSFALGGVCADFEGNEPRTYSLFAYHLQVGPDTPITPTISYEFQPLGTATKKNVIVVADWKEEDDDEEENGDEELWKLIEDGRESKPGARLLVGYFPEPGIVFYINDIEMVSGSKPEYGDGGFEFVCWNPGTHTIRVDDQGFYVDMGDNEIAHIHLEKTGGSEPSARLISTTMLLGEAEALLQELEDDGFAGIFTVEEV